MSTVDIARKTGLVLVYLLVENALVQVGITALNLLASHNICLSTCLGLPLASRACHAHNLPFSSTVPPQSTVGVFLIMLVMAAHLKAQPFLKAAYNVYAMADALVQMIVSPAHDSYPLTLLGTPPAN